VNVNEYISGNNLPLGFGVAASLRQSQQDTGRSSWWSSLERQELSCKWLPFRTLFSLNCLL